jgi:hypothetical protein
MGEFMMYSIEMGLDAMIFIPCFLKICVAIQKLIECMHIQTHSKMVSYGHFNFLIRK